MQKGKEMTDKQIIIDGVDVSGCEWYSSTYFKPCDGCKNTPNCYYKQLKRDEQRIVELNKTIKAKEQECERLKQTLAQIKEIAEKIDDSDGCAYGDYDCNNCSSLEQETVCTYKIKKLILQKISECEVENE